MQLPSAALETSAGKKQVSGWRAYAVDHLVPDYVPTDTDLPCAFRIEPLDDVDMIEASAAAAAEAIASGKTLDDAAKSCPELLEAMGLWGKANSKWLIEKWCAPRVRESP